MQSRLFIAITLIAVVSAAIKVSNLPVGIDQRDVIPDQYLVRFKSGNTQKTLSDHVDNLLKLVGGGRASVKSVFDTKGLEGYSAELNSVSLNEVLNSPLVLTVEQDFKIRLDASEFQEEREFVPPANGGRPSRSKRDYCEYQDLTASGYPQYNLDRIDNKVDYTYRFPGNAGEDVDVIVIDSGVRRTHAEFDSGQATQIANFINSNNYDQNGHGTHVAGTIAGWYFGVAKWANIRAIKVFDASGSSSYSVIYNAITFAIGYATSNLPRRSVINMSLGGPAYGGEAITAATRAATEYGIVVVVSAGNSNSFACDSTPATASSGTPVITVGASDASNNKAGFSNYGRCVSINAPGVDIWAASYTGTYNLVRMSGTSMAAPHVAGAAALLLSENPRLTPAQVKTKLIVQSRNLINNNCPGGLFNLFSECNQTPKALVQVQCNPNERPPPRAQ